MTTRCNIEIYHQTSDDRLILEAILCHIMDGNPGFMGPKLYSFLEYIWNEKGIYHPQLIAASMVMLSCGSYENPTELDDIPNLSQEDRERIMYRDGRPCFQINTGVNPNIAYLWRIIFTLKGYELDCIEVYQADKVPSREKIDWQEACIREHEYTIKLINNDLVDARRTGDRDEILSCEESITRVQGKISEYKKLFGTNKTKVGG